VNLFSSTSSLTAITLPTGANCTFDNNTITNISTTGGGGINLIGIQTQIPSTLSANVLNGFTVNSGTPGNANIYGVLQAGGATVNINGNTFSGFSSNSITGSATGSQGLVDAVYVAAGTTTNIGKNNIYNLALTNAASTTSFVHGIHINAGTTVNVSNNYISDLRHAGSNADGIRGIGITNSTASTSYNLYFNTIYLNATTSQATFGTTGLYHTSSATATTVALNLRNNIIVNVSAPGSTAGLTVAFRRNNATLANYVSGATGSNNNVFYAGTPSASNLLYYDPTNTNVQTLAAFQTLVTPRETASLSTMPQFMNIAATPYNLHLKLNANCAVSDAGSAIAGFTDDFDADIRNVTTPDIGADEFTATGSGAGVWRGVTTDWMDINNWCGEVPTATTNVTIPAAAAFYPIITTTAPVARNITIIAGGSIEVTSTGKLGIYGSITNGGLFRVGSGTIEMLGASQTIPAGAFENDSLKNLIISNTPVTLGGTLNVYGKLSFTGSNRVFATAGFLTLKSNAAGTASVGDITNNGANTGNSITGNVTVERFMSARRAWRFLSVPTQNNLQTIHEAWQENQPANATTPIGYGIHITKDSANWNTTGFDLQTTPGPSMKYYVPASNAWKGITSTINAGGSDGKFVTGMGYMTLVRGDRQINYFPATANTTVLRAKGALYTGNFVAPVGAGQFASIGNPYASAIDFSKIPAPDKVNIAPFYYLWDPYMGTLGAYVTFATSGTHTASTSYGANYFIESGQAFFVNSSGPAGSLTLTEPNKVDGSNLVSRPTGTGKQLQANLYLVENNERSLYDAVVSEFDASYSASTDALDAIKMINFGENLGIMRGDKKLSVDRMPELVETDTIFYNLSQMRVKTYQFEFIPENIGQTGLAAFLEDKYLNIKTPVSFTDTSRIDFSIINDPGSYAPDRFRLVFLQAAPVPVTFSSIRANRLRNDILVEWKVENELNIAHYELEKSANGVNFSKVNEQVARGNGLGTAIQYNWLDTNPLEGDNFYRVRSVGISNEVKLSQVVKVNMGKLVSEITVFPNPVREDGIVYISLNNKPAGNYQLNLVNSEGQTVMKKTLNHAGGNSVYSITMDKFAAHGNYLVNITGDNSVNLTFKIVY